MKKKICKECSDDKLCDSCLKKEKRKKKIKKTLFYLGLAGGAIVGVAALVIGATKQNTQKDYEEYSGDDYDYDDDDDDDDYDDYNYVYDDAFSVWKIGVPRCAAGCGGYPESCMGCNLGGNG